MKPFMDSSPTMPEKTEANSVVLKHPPHDNRTPCGYRPGPLKASDGTRYLVEVSGQIRRLDPKMSKVEAKRHKKERRLENLRHQERAAAALRRNP